VIRGARGRCGGPTGRRPPDPGARREPDGSMPVPTYDYQCAACGHEFEKFQSITAPAVRKCPLCGKRKVRRLIGTGAGVIFKGSGFYQTDYRSESYKKAAEKDRKATDGGDKKPSGEGAAKAPAAEGAGKGAAGAGSKPKKEA
jgi:putative FmdB family regulatory protein